MSLPRALLLAAASTLTLQAVPALIDVGSLGGTYTNFEPMIYNGGTALSSFSGNVLAGTSYLAGNTAQHGFIYTGGVMTDIGTLGGTHTYVRGVSSNGMTVVGNSNLVGNSAQHAFIYTGGAMTDIGTLGGSSSWATGASANGSTVVGSSNLAGDATQRGFIYAGGAMTDIGTLGGSSSWVTGLSANGSVVVGNSQLAGDSAQHGFIYAGGVMTDIGTLGGSSSSVTGISGNGLIVAGNADIVGNGDQHGFIYTGGVMTDIGTLGGAYSHIDALSVNGLVAIGYSGTAGGMANHAFIYSGGVMTDLTDLLFTNLGAINYGQAFGLSADGSVVVGYYYVSGGSGYRAFSYANGALSDLGDFGSNNIYAAGVSGDGSTIYGNSYFGGAQHAFVLSLAPTTITSTINGSDSRVTGGNTLQFQGGTFAPVGAGTLNLTNAITVQASSTGTLDATGQNLAVSGPVTINGTSLTLQGSATSTITLSGYIAGSGNLINASGVNTLTQSSAYAGSTIVNGGRLIQVGTSLSPSNQLATGGTLEFNVAAGTLSSGSTVFTGTGTLVKSGAGSLMWGVSSATFSFSHGALIHVAEGVLIGGSNWSEVWTNNHSDLQVDAGARFSGVEADVRIDRLLGSGVVSTGLAHPDYHGFTVGVDGGSSTFSGTIVDSSVLLGELGKLVKVGAGDLTLTGANTYSGGTTLQAGALRAGNESAFGSGTLTLSGGALSSDGSTAHTLANAVVVGGDVILGDAVKDGALTLSGTVDVAAGSTVTVASAVTLSGDVQSTGAFTKAGSGALTLAAAGTISAPTLVVSNGLLTNNGTINGGITVATTGIFGGSGTINGAVLVDGTLAPGNSPGLQIQATGDTSLATGAHFQAQLGGTTAGNGDGFHDQYYVQAGSFDLATGVTLDVRSWVKADGVTTFTPARGDVFTIIRAADGINGVFSDLTNTDYAQWVLFDNSQVAHAFGNLYGTGLNGNQTFAAYGSNATRAAIGASLWAAAVDVSDASTASHPAGFIYAGSAAGDAAIGLLTAPDVNAYLDALSPELYLAAGDYALTVSRSVTDAAWGQNSLIKVGAWTVGAGYNRAQHGYRGADAASDYELSGDTSLVTLTHDFGPHCSVGFFYGYNTGKTVAGNGRLDYRGNVFGLTSVGRFEGKRPVTLKAALVATDLRFDAVRNGSVVHDQALRSLSGQLTASVEVYRDGRLSCAPLLGFVQGRSTSAAFAEAGSGALLNVESTERHSARALAGVGFGYILSNDLTLDATFAYEHEFTDAPAVVTATFADARETLPMSIDRATLDRGTTSASLGASWKIDNSVTLRLSAETRGNRELHKDYRYNAGLNYRF